MIGSCCLKYKTKDSAKNDKPIKGMIIIKKIKNDLIKFLLNLNIVVSSEEKTKEEKEEVIENKSDKKVGRNEKCPCGSGKKFKHCHGNI